MATTQVKCGRCDGKGKATFEDVCIGCGGDGFVRVNDPPTKCARCGGKGKLTFEDICKGCKGSGWVQD
ncbi:MAG: DnaJ central domain [Acidobacteriota bacterium]|nr:DnaJ central domain [Acidobacteriota bacterium]